MRRFVKHFYVFIGAEKAEDEINLYAEANKLKIITLTTHGAGIFVLFEESEDTE